MRMKPVGIMLCLVGVLAGLLLTTQARLHESLRKDVLGMRSDELVAYSKSLEAEVVGLRAETAELRSIYAAAASEERVGSALAEELTSLQAFLGLLPVKGPGITVVVDVSRKGPVDAQLQGTSIQSEDLLRIINLAKGQRSRGYVNKRAALCAFNRDRD